MSENIFKNTENYTILEKMYAQMYLIRCFEERLEDLFRKGMLFGTIHSCIGQEAIAVGIANALTKEDVITGNHRSHGHYIAFTDDVDGLMAEIMGKASGIVGGRGGSQHIHSKNFYSNGVQGSLVPVATGIAMAEKEKKNKNVVICFIGDGTLGQGVVYESMNIASLWNLPIIFLVENNYYAMSTHVGSAIAGSMINRGKAFGIDSSETTSNDVELIHAEAKIIIEKVKSKSSPYFWVINTYRLCGHSKSDDRCYRSMEEEQAWRKIDPLVITGSKINSDKKIEIEKECESRISKAVEKISADSFPDIKEICEDTYCGYR